ncbi:MAG TPA: DEAD/DEAH box helicase, partial [Streptosporangiaceae bacterium]|nr:DEAD/DEAH box helicase [Streptosporangiaceae bacterium]
ELQRLTPERACRDAEGVADLLRSIGPVSAAEVAERSQDPAAAAGWLADLARQRRALEFRIAGEARWAAIEDAGRLRDALGVPLPPGVPAAFTEPVPDPLSDLVARYARGHGPFLTADLAQRYGLGVAVVTGALRRLAAEGRVAEGEFLPGRRGTQWCDTSVLRTLRRRCLAKLRKEAEPVPPSALARFLPAWQNAASGAPANGSKGGSAGLGRRASADAVYEAIDQLAGAAMPASALETLILPGRVPGYQPAMLDELTAAGEVVWSGAGGLPGGDGWVALAPADTAPLLLPGPGEITLTPLHEAVLAALDGGGGMFFRMLADRAAALLPDGARGEATDAAVAAAIWDLVWAGRITNDTLAALRTVLGTGRPVAGGGPAAQAPARRTAVRPGARGRGRGGFGRPAMPSRTGPPTVTGRWSLVPPADPDATRRLHALARTLLDRHGILIRGAVAAERVPGGFAAIYPVLRAMEDAGQCRRGYFVEGLGAAQFALPGAVDRMRALAAEAGPGETPADPWARAGGEGAGWPAPGFLRNDNHLAPAPSMTVLAAGDPANPFGAALPWPERPGEAPGGHRPGRKAGSLVVLAGGELVLYVERGGKTLLSWSSDPAVLRPAAAALAGAARGGALGRLTIERADGSAVQDSPLAQALEEAGFRPTPRGLRLRAKVA